MKKIKIFWKKACPNCPAAKELGRKAQSKGFNVQFYDVDTAEGLAEGSFYNVMATPTIVITDSSEIQIKIWSSIIPSLEEFSSFLVS